MLNTMTIRQDSGVATTILNYLQTDSVLGIEDILHNNTDFGNTEVPLTSGEYAVM